VASSAGGRPRRGPRRLGARRAGGSIAGPVKKNKLFMFTAYEGWRSQEPNGTLRTMPTDLERQGDFSQSRNINGGLRAIYDPWTTKLDPTTGAVSVQPFPGNKISADRFDPLTASLMKQFWGPNNPGDNITGVNNYKKGFIEKYNYKNWSERADYNISDKWRAFGRLSRYYTDDLAGNPTPLQNRSLFRTRFRRSSSPPQSPRRRQCRRIPTGPTARAGHRAHGNRSRRRQSRRQRDRKALCARVAPLQSSPG